MDYIEVRIRNFKGYKGRADVANNSWFRMSNRILEDHEFFDFDPSELKVWIYLLCLSSQKNTEIVRVSYRHAHRVCGIEKRWIDSAIKKLKRNKCIDELQKRGGRGRYVADTQTGATDRQTDITVQDKTRQNSNAHAEAFALFWKAYPRKVGKEKSEKSYRRLIESGLTPDEISKALAHYLAYLRREKIEAKYIKHGPTFMNEVRDWLDPNHGSSESFAESKEINWDALPDLGGESA